MDKTSRLKLKQQSHQLKPVVIIGNQGVTSSVLNEINTALTAHELIKVRVNAESKSLRVAMTQVICENQQAELVSAIGHIITLYRKSEKAPREDRL